MRLVWWMVWLIRNCIYIWNSSYMHDFASYYLSGYSQDYGQISSISGGWKLIGRNHMRGRLRLGCFKWISRETYKQVSFTRKLPIIISIRLNIEEDIVQGRENRMKNCFMRIGGVLKYCWIWRRKTYVRKSNAIDSRLLIIKFNYAVDVSVQMICIVNGWFRISIDNLLKQIHKWYLKSYTERCRELCFEEAMLQDLHRQDAGRSKASVVYSAGIVTKLATLRQGSPNYMPVSFRIDIQYRLYW